MGFLDYLSPVIGGLSSVAGLIQDSNARAAAQRAQQQALQEYGQGADQQYQDMLGNNSRTLMGAAGQGGTALANLGSNMGSALAGSGVYNSSVVGGALGQAQANTNSAIADLAARNEYNANTFHDQAQQHLAQMRLGQANIDYGNANADLQGSRQGLGSFIGSLASSNLLGQQPSAQPAPDYSQILSSNNIPDSEVFSRAAAPLGSASALGTTTQDNLTHLGVNYSRLGLSSIPGTVNQGANLGGNAGGIGNGGQGASGSNQFYQPQGYSGWNEILNRYTSGQGGVLSGR